MNEGDIREQCRTGLIAALEPFGDEQATAEVLELAAALPFNGDIDAYVQAATAMVQTVWNRKVAETEVRVREVEAQLAIVRAVQLMPESHHIH